MDSNAVFEAFHRILLQQSPLGVSPTGANLHLEKICYHPPGATSPLLQDVSFELKTEEMGLICGKSGAGKTTLLQVITGLTEQTSGTISISQKSSKGPTSF